MNGETNPRQDPEPKIRAFLKEFGVKSFLREEERIVSVRVERIDIQRIHERPIKRRFLRWKWWKFQSWASLRERIYFLNCRFENLGEVGWQVTAKNPEGAWWKYPEFIEITYTDGTRVFQVPCEESIWEGYDRLKSPEGVVYILSIRPVEMAKRDQFSVQVTIYKIPNGYPLGDWIEKILEPERASLAERINTIDQGQP